MRLRVSPPMAGPFEAAAGVHVECVGPPRPAWRVELAAGRRIRVVFREQRLLHARPAADYSGVELLRGAGPRTSPLPPLGARAASRIDAPADSPAFVEAWCWFFLRLLDAVDGPLHRGAWRLEPAALVPLVAHPPPGHRPIYAPGASGGRWLDPGPRHTENWRLNGSGALLPLRSPTPPEAGRVKALRKLVREARLPPLLLLYVTGLDMNLLLDGHDRLHAALLEGVAPPALVLTPVRYTAWPPQARADELAAEIDRTLSFSASAATVSRVNRRRLGAFAVGDWRPRTRAWAIPGGATAWDGEVAARLQSLT